MKKIFQFFGRNFLLFAAILACQKSSDATAQTLYTIITNGPASNRVNLVLFSEGYTSAQLGQFLSDATNSANFFLSAQPYAEYSNYFNVFAIAVASAHSGSTHLSYPMTYVNGYTYFNSTYDANSDYITTIPPNPSDSDSSHGQGKISALLQQFLPATNNDLPAVLVNDLTAGGSDNYGSAAISSVNNVNYILVHESGHTLGNLGDEYSNPYPGYPDTEEPNTTMQTNIALVKWRAWIPTNTPIPTPPTGTYANTVGVFQGAHYHATGWYRPYLNCCMGSFGIGFCPVCQETLVLAIYGRVRPIDNHSPATNALSVMSPQMLTFNLSLLKPATHSLNIQWRTNGITVADATNQIFTVLPSQLGNGTQKIEADVLDGTAMVRTDTTNLLKQTNIWTLNVAIPSLQIDSAKWQTNGDFTFRVTGSSPYSIAIQSSTNLFNWIALQTNSLGGGQFFYTNFGANTSSLKRFYRAATPP